MNRRGAWIVTGLVIAAAWLMAWYIGLRPAAVESTPHPFAALPVKYTPTTRTEPARFRLLGGERQLKLVTHAVADAPGPIDADEVVIYGLRLTLIDLVGEVLWSGQLHTSGRRSVDPRTTIDGVPPRPDAYLADPKTPDVPLDDAPGVYDSRLLQFQIPKSIPPESRLVVEPIGDAQTVFVRLFAREDPRSGIGFKALDLLRDETPPVDDMLAERVPRSLRWIRRSSELATVVVMRTGNRRPFDENEVKAFVPVDPLRPVALNVEGAEDFEVEGPTAFELRVKRGIDDETAAVPGHGSVRMIDTAEKGDAGLPAGVEVPIPDVAGVEVVQHFEVGEGVHSLKFYTDRVGGARIRLTSPVRQPAPGAGRLRPPVRFGDVPVVPYLDDELLLPDERRFPVFVVGPDDPPVNVGIEGPDDDLARLVRLDVRLMKPSPVIGLAAMEAGAADPAHLRSIAFEPTTVEVTWRGAEDARLGQRVLSVAPPQAPFEELERGDGTRIKVSEPQGLRIAVPSGTRRIEVRAPVRLTVRPHVLFPAPPPYLALPYREHLPDDHIWRYAPREFRIWYPVSPLNRDDLRAVDRVLTMVTQVRLEPLGPGDAEGPKGPPGVFSPIEPVGRPAQQRVLENVRPDRVSEVRREWGAGLLAAVPAGRPVRFRVDRGSRARPRLIVALDGPAEGLLGKALSLRIDGRDRGRVVLGTTRFAHDMPALNAGWHTLEVRPEGDGPVPDGLTLHIDRATEKTAIFHQRTLYELGRRGLDVRVPVDADGVVLNAIVYDRRPGPVPTVLLEGVIDGGEPVRQRGVPVESFTLGTERRSLPEARKPITTARLVDRTGQVAGHPRIFPVRLGPDLTPGGHMVRVRAEADRVLWVRFIIAEDLSRRDEAVRAGTFIEAE